MIRRPPTSTQRTATAPTPTPRPAGSRQGGIKLANLNQVEGSQPKGLLRGREPGGEITQVGRSGGLADLGITEVPVVDITAPAGQPTPGGGKDFIAGYFKQTATPAGYLTGTAEDVVAVEKVIPESLVTKQQTIGGRVADQTANAIDSAEDQMTGRVKSQLQRNEDLDISQIDLLEEMAEQDRNWMMEQDEPINRVATQLPDGLPVDQAEGAEASAQKFAQTQVKKQQRSKENLLDIEYKMYDMVAGAAEQGMKMEPQRALAILTNPTIELTQDELSLFKVNPDIGKFALKTQTYSPGERQTGAAVGILGDRLKSIPNVGLDPQSPITQAASGTSIRGRSRIQNEPEQFRQRVSSSRRPLESDVIDIDEGGTVTVYPGAELQELELNEQTGPGYIRRIANQFTGELEQEYAPKNMRAINTVEGKTYFVPVNDPGGEGIYGIERSYASGPIVKFDDPSQGRVAGAFTKSAMRRPTEMPFTEKQQGGSRFSALSNQQLENFVQKAPEGTIRTAGQQEQMRRQTSQQSLKVSEAVRRANIEGRDPNMVLRQLGFDL
jgi:hypothetical protein